MRKNLFVIGLLYISLFLTSCNFNLEDINDSNNSDDIVDQNDESMTFVHAELASLIGTYEPSEGTIFLKVQIDFEYDTMQNASLIDFYCSLDIGSYGIRAIEEYLNGFDLYVTDISDQLIWFVFELENIFLTNDKIDILEVQIYNRLFEISESDL